MPRSSVLILLAVTAAFPAEDDWAKVAALKSGTEVRVYKKGTPQPVVARFNEATSENLIVVIKNEQVAIAKDAVVRVDARPAQRTSRYTSETKSIDDTSKPRPVGGVPGSVSSTSSGLTITGKPDFETVYRRAPAPPKK